MELVPAMTFAVTGLIIGRARPENSIGWLLLGCSVSATLLVLAEAYGLTALVSGSGWPLATVSLWVATWMWPPPLLVPASLLLIRYPSGLPSTRAWRRLDRALVVGIVALTVALMFSPDGVDDYGDGLSGPVAFPPLAFAGVIVGAPLLLLGIPLCVLGTVQRWWRSSAPERQQLIWLLATSSMAVASNFADVVPEPVGLLAYSLVPVAVAIGLLRYRLLDIEVVVKRGLVYGMLTAVVAVAFAAATAATRASSSRIGTLVASAAIAVAIVPVRDILQGGVDRVVYGDRRQPLRAVERLGRQLVDAPVDALVPAVLATVCDALRVPGCAAVDDDDVAIATFGVTPGSTATVVGLTVGGVRIGHLALADRPDHEPLTRGDRDLLRMLTPQVAVVIRAAGLAGALDAERHRVVEARNKERRRLRHDLHDTLGPSLSGVGLGLEAARAQVVASSPAAATLIDRLRLEVGAAVVEIRRIIDDLGPIQLEATSLLDAVRGLAASTSLRSGLHVEVLADPLPVLPTPVASAVLRITNEAITNVVRHAGAQCCEIRLGVADGLLDLTITDDGRGIYGEPTRLGVGLRSMRDRAEALGGTFHVDGHAGTIVAVCLPIAALADRS